MLENELLKLSSKHALLPFMIDDKDSDIYMQHIMSTMRMSSEMFKIIELFERDGISSIPFKGAVLSVLCYGDISKRQYSDIDIFIDKKDRDRTIAILKSIGYEESLDIPPSQREYWYSQSKDISLRNRELGITIELHWRLFDRDFPISISTDLIKRERISIQISGRDIDTFSPKLYFIYLSIHGAKHFWSRLGWIKDIDTLISRYKIDIVNIIDNCKNIDTKNMLLFSLYLTNKIYSTPIPKEIVPKFEYKRFQRFEEFIYINWDNEQSGLKRAITMILFLKRYSAKYRYIKYTIFRPSLNEYRLIELPISLSWLYIIIRPIRLFKKYIIGSFCYKSTQKE